MDKLLHNGIITISSTNEKDNTLNRYNINTDKVNMIQDINDISIYYCTYKDTKFKAIKSSNNSYYIV